MTQLVGTTPGVIQHRASKVSGNSPPSLADGEFAVQQADGLLFWIDASGNIQAVSIKPPTTVNAQASNVSLTANTANAALQVSFKATGTTALLIGNCEVSSTVAGTSFKVMLTLTDTTAGTAASNGPPNAAVSPAAATAVPAIGCAYAVSGLVVNHTYQVTLSITPNNAATAVLASISGHNS